MVKNIVIWSITIWITIVHQLISGGTNEKGTKQHLRSQETLPPPPHSDGKQPHPTVTQEDSRDETLTVVTEPSSNPAAAIQEEVSLEILTKQHQLGIDQNSTIGSDIVKIWHDEDSKEICVALKHYARCPHPALLGRLSGPALAILEWNNPTAPTVGADADGTVLCGGYGHNWLDAGEYFVEIIILYCNDFGMSAPRRTDDTTAWMEADNRLECVEDVKRNRITSKSASIHVPTSTGGLDNYRLGRWIRKHDLPSRPLFTRSQPLECAGKVFGFELPGRGSPMQQYCDETVNRDTFDPKDLYEYDYKWNRKNGKGLYEYDFQWNMKVSEQELLEKFRQRQRDNTTPKICAIGDSHSKLMYKRTLPWLNLTGQFETYIRHEFPAPDKIVKKIKQFDCDVFFVQVSQWPASHYMAGQPFPFAKYHEKVKQLAQNIINFNPNATVYLPTADQAPLMARIVNCSDWRTPTMLDGYSHLQQMIVKELNAPQVKYIDTNFIINTHWDGHEDWQHLMEVVRSRKTIYMLAIMLGETEWFEWSDASIGV